VTDTVDPSTQQVERLSMRLERERLTRRDAELISERATRELYEQQAALRLLTTVATTCNEAATTAAAMQGAIDQVCAHTGWPLGHALLLDREAGELVTTRTWHLAVAGRFDPFRELTERTRFARGVGLPGRVLAAGHPAWITDVTRDANFPRAPTAREVGLKAAFAFPVLSQRECVAVLEFFSPQTLEPDEALLELMGHIGLQLGRVVERKWGEEELARLSYRTQVLLSSAGEGIYGMGPDGRTSFVNPAAARMLGWAADELTGRPLHEVVHARPTSGPRHDGDFCPLQIPHRQLGEHHTAEDVFNRRDGSHFPVAYILTPIRDGGEVSGAVITFNDITERKRFESQLRYLADRDPLTGLFNRRHFEAELGRQVAHADRHAPAGAALLLDLDNFKYVNDTLGHGAGDDLIRSISGVLRGRLRETDVVARLGGDEFAVLVVDADAAKAEKVAADLGEAVRRNVITVGDRPLRVTASIGVAPLRRRELTAEEVLMEADIAMYRAKEAGRDRYAVYTPEAARRVGVTAGLTWVERIRRALDEDLFVLYAQPILNLASGRMSHVELLLRMRGEQGDVVLPGAFLPPAERFGLIQEIDRWVVGQAIQLIADQRDQGQALETLVAINLSGRSVGDPGLPDLIERELAARGVGAASLVFEITETSAIANMEEARRFADRLAKLGCRLALDDFGAGFGSFYYLKYLPLDYLKIDGDFITNLPRSPVDQHMVKAMVDVARGLGMKTIAEFVGDEPTLALLPKLGVDYAQGFHIGSPAPIEELRADPSILEPDG
jgi:diguanylate cyclase (GGDEF)-like protein/PAS domain S-box-containing protein